MNGIRQELERLYSELLNYNAANICPILQRCAGGQLWNRGRRVGGKQGEQRECPICHYVAGIYRRRVPRIPGQVRRPPPLRRRRREAGDM